MKVDEQKKLKSGNAEPYHMRDTNEAKYRRGEGKTRAHGLCLVQKVAEGIISYELSWRVNLTKKKKIITNISCVSIRKHMYNFDFDSWLASGSLWWIVHKRHRQRH